MAAGKLVVRLWQSISQRYGRAGGGLPTLKASFERQLPLLQAAEKRVHALALGQAVAPYSPKPIPLAKPEKKTLPPKEQLAAFTVDDQYEVNLYASEADGVVKPIQFAWDENGGCTAVFVRRPTRRLWPVRLAPISYSFWRTRMVMAGRTGRTGLLRD